MNYKEFERLLKRAQSKSLPGEKAQLELAPSGRLPLSELDIEEQKPRKAGVLALFETREDEVNLILTERTKYPGAHSGQISFPGGGYEDQDEIFLNTAIRETREEIGVKSERYTIWGALTPLYIPPSNFLVHPFLAHSSQSLNFIKEEKEVASIRSIPFARFLEPEAISDTKIELSNGFKIKSKAFLIEDLVIWGATAMMIAEIRRMILNEMGSL